MNDIRLNCHCGAVEINARLSAPLSQARRCDCSFCRRRGAAMVSARVGDLQIIRGADHLRLYQFNTGTAKHYFCPTCGIYTHHQRRSDPREYGLNLGAIEGVNPRDFEPIGWVDGINHPSDTA